MRDRRRARPIRHRRLDAGIRRLVLLHAVTYAWGGVPLLYMGDGLALPGDVRYLDDPALADDNRWMHRPWMDPAAQARRADPATLEGRVFGWLRRLAQVRGELLALHAGAASEVLDLDDPHVLGWRRRHPRSGWFVGLVNVAEDPASVDARVIDGLDTVLSSDGPPPVRDGRAHLPGLGFVWLAEA